MCLDHLGELTRGKKGSKREDRKCHIATDDGPMVHGGLLKSHPGSVHDDGEAPGGGSSLRQGVGIGSPDSPDLETAVAAEQRRDREKDSPPRVFGASGKYRR